MNVAIGTRVAAVGLAALVAACSSDNGGHPAESAGRAPSTAPASVAAGQGRAQVGTGAGHPAAAVAPPVVQCGNHLRMALIMSDPAQPVRAQVTTFTRAARPAAPAWEVAAFRSAMTRFSAVVAGRGKRAALQMPAFGYSTLVRLCRQSARK